MNLIKIAHSSYELVKQYNYLNSGYFFDKDTMRFFNSKVTANFKRLDNNNALFITTEKFDKNSSRYATVRHAKLEYKQEFEDGLPFLKISIKTIGEFNVLTLYKAKKLMNSLTLKDVQ